jgi:hypothetical protein
MLCILPPQHLLSTSNHVRLPMGLTAYLDLGRVAQTGLIAGARQSPRYFTLTLILSFIEANGEPQCSSLSIL